MTDRSTVIVSIGEETYQEACSAARKAAAGTGASLGHEGFNSNVPHDISHMVWHFGGDDKDKLELTFRFYEEMPCYAYLIYISNYFGEFYPATKTILWSKYKHYLSGEDTLADPVAYSLWCDFFEDSTRVREAWSILTGNNPSQLLLRRLLISSGPVPFAEKHKLYQSLLPHPQWHYYIFRSLLHSQFDVYGCIDRTKAKAILKKLVLPRDTEYLQRLEEAVRK
jgi:hypothetical protein